MAAKSSRISSKKAGKAGPPPKDPDQKPIKEFQNVRANAVPLVRLEQARRAARQFRERMLAGPKVVFYKSMDLVRVPYPTRYGLLNCGIRTPYMHILNRLFVVQYRAGRQIKTLLFSPSDIDANRETPFFKRLSQSMGPLRPLGEKIIAPVYSTVEAALKALEIAPEQVDYIAYDHLHTQDLRKWLGSGSRPAYFPRAKLLVQRQEWESTQGLLPPQADWYCPNGTGGIPESKIYFLNGDTMIGDGLALVATPGHTEGNHSLVCHTEEGLLVSSENGVSADNYAPHASRINAVRRYAQATGMEIILNGNTLEGGLDQYISMVVEKEIAGPSVRDSEFCNFVPSSEMAAYWAFPGLRPSFSFGPLQFGEIAKKKS